MNANDYVDILMKEYASVKADMVAQTSGAYTLATVAGAVFATAIALSAQFLGHIWVARLIGSGLLVLILFFCHNWRCVKNQARRLREVEAHINVLAGTPLIRYESEFGGAVRNVLLTGPVIRQFPRPEIPNGTDPQLASHLNRVFDSNTRNK